MRRFKCHSQMDVPWPPCTALRNRSIPTQNNVTVYPFSGKGWANRINFVSDSGACRILSSHFRFAVQQLVNGIQLARMTTTKRFIRPVLSPAVSSLVVRVNHNW